MQPIIHIFLVEDDQDDQQFFVDAVGSLDNVLLSDVARNGREAIEKLRNMSVLPSIIFADCDMPVMNGLEFLKEKSRYPLIKSVPVIMLSGSFDKREEALKLGAKIFILKQQNEQTLIDEVTQAINIDL
jgi:CheY-like chemotaxis protein